MCPRKRTIAALPFGTLVGDNVQRSPVHPVMPHTPLSLMHCVLGYSDRGSTLPSPPPLKGGFLCCCSELMLGPPCYHPEKSCKVSVDLSNPQGRCY